jgi:hypothetical protein
MRSLWFSVLAMVLAPPPVGFHVRWIQGPAESCRQQLRVLVWYPALPSSHSPRATVATYAAAAGDTAAASEIASFASSPLDPHQVESILATPTRAVPDAEPMAGRHPLVLLGNGFGPPYFLQWALAEQLASDGYVVATVAGASCDEHRGASLANVQAMARDMEAVAASFTKDDNVDTDHLGLVGWSGGGLAQAFMSATDSRVRAMVSLDGATGYEYGKQMFDSVPSLDRSRLTVPYVHLTGDATPRFVVEKSFFFYDSLAHGPRYLVHIEPLSHSSFSTLGALVAGLARPYRNAIRYTEWFLDAYVRDDPTAKARIRVKWRPS